jgi:hypothetical protein
MNLLSCPVCFGDPSSPLTQSAKWGVLFLLVVVVAVLAVIACVAAVWARRARALAQSEARGNPSERAEEPQTA